jgi:hypothetical protein
VEERVPFCMLLVGITAIFDQFLGLGRCKLSNSRDRDTTLGKSRSLGSSMSSALELGVAKECGEARNE